MKLICGVGNNAAWVVMMNAYDEAKKCKSFKRSLRGGHTVKWYFNKAVNAFKAYEHTLTHPKANRMFHVADMDAGTRRKYGDITDEDYYEFWKGIGGVAYSKTKPFTYSLWNKYRVSLVNHGINDAEHIAWVMTAQAALELACDMHKMAIDECVSGYDIPREIACHIFGQFSLRKVADEWRNAMMLLAPEIEPIQLDSVEERNIDLGIQQMMDAWMNPELLYSSTEDAVADYEEIFATKGFMKKALREIAEVKAKTIAELQ